MGTHTSQHPPAKVAGEAADYMVYMHRMVDGSNHNWCFILNMDQMPVYFAMSTKHMLELFGKKQFTFAPWMVDGSNHNWCFILNMDQMPVYFAMSTKHMLELFGKKQFTFARWQMTPSARRSQ